MLEILQLLVVFIIAAIVWGAVGSSLEVLFIRYFKAKTADEHNACMIPAVFIGGLAGFVIIALWLYYKMGLK